MLTVKTPEEVFALLREEFPPLERDESVPLPLALGRVLAEDIQSTEYVPGFNRSTVDGYAVRAADTFGCSDAIPAILPVTQEIFMGGGAQPLTPGSCAAVPTGGAVPEGADAVVMLEYAEDYGDGTVGLTKSAAPGANLIYKGDDVYPGKLVLPKGQRLGAQDIGALAAMGVSSVSVSKKVRVGILSTGDELVPVEEIPAAGQVRDVNSSLLAALMTSLGAEVVPYGIFPDTESILAAGVDRALAECDVVLLSGGSSVGVKDAACRILSARGDILLHGIAMKPGKPNILAKIGGKAVFGLPGHPVAAFFSAQLFVRALLTQLTGEIRTAPRTVSASLSEAISANHGRAEYIGVRLEKTDNGLLARPIHGKSGLITSLAASEGFFCVPRDREGFSAGETVEVLLY